MDSSWWEQDWQEQAWEHPGGWEDRRSSGQFSVSSAEWRGWTRTASPSGLPKSEEEQPCFKKTARRFGTWRDKLHQYEGHEALRCPWPGGKETFGHFSETGNWFEVLSEARDLGLAALLVFFCQSIFF